MTESHYGEQIRIKKTNLTHPHAHADPRRRATSSEAPGACPGRVLRRHTQGRLGLGVLTSSLVSVTGASLVLNTKQEQAPSCSQVQPGAQGSAHKPMVLGKGSLSASFWEACFPIQQAFFFLNKIYLFVYLAAPDLSYSMQDLFPDQELDPGPQHLEVCGLSHWTTREVLNNFFIKPLRVTVSPL